METIAKLLLLILICVAVPVNVHAESAQSLTARGNDLYASGEYDQALEAYEQAGTEQPDSAEIWFNKGNAFFQKGDYDKAREAYETAAVRTRDLSLEAGSHFNLGNTAFFDGQKQLGEDPKKALSQFRTSVQHYKEALRVDPRMEDAARNIEVVRVKMKDVLDLIRKQEEQAKEQKAKQEELLKQLEEAVGEQESEIGASEALKKTMDENPGKEYREEAKKLAEDQNKTREKTGEVSDKLKAFQSEAVSPQQPQEGQPRDNPAQSAAEHLERAQEAQKEAAEGLEDRRLEGVKDRQQEALDRLKEALAKLSGPQEGKQSDADRKESGEEQQNKEKSDGQESGQDQNQESEQANRQSIPKQSDEQEMQQGEKGQGKKDDESKARAALRELPDDILREEKENRLQFERSHSGAYQPVDRDW